MTKYEESMKAAAASWGISVAIQQIAKSAGCRAFAGSRVRRAELEEWIAANPKATAKAQAITDGAELKRQKLAAEVELLRAKLAREHEATVPLEEARSETARCISIGMEEAKSFMEPDHYRVFCERWKSRNGEVMP